MATWKQCLEQELKEQGETFNDIEASTLTQEQLNKEFHDGFGFSEGCPFTVWTKRRVYFPAVYDGSEWVESVSRHPDGNPTKHIGGE